jgi:hypothetical protein
LPPTEADALLTRPTIDRAIQESEAAAAAAEAAKLAGGATVNVVLNQQPGGAAGAPVALPPQSGGGKPPTLEIFEVSAHEGQEGAPPAPTADAPGPDTSEIKVLSVTAFDPQANK